MIKQFTKKIFVLFFVIFFIATGAHAQKGKSNSGSPRFSYGLMALMATGKMGNGLSDAPDRDMLFTPIDLFVGFNIKKFRLGLNYEYMLTGQTTDPSNVAGTNVSGTGSVPGVRLEYYDGKNSFGLVYRLSDNYNLDKPTPNGSSVTYKASGGFSIQYTRQLKNRIGIVIDYSTETFTSSLSTSNVKWNRLGLGVVFSNFSGH